MRTWHKGMGEDRVCDSGWSQIDTSRRCEDCDSNETFIVSKPGDMLRIASIISPTTSGWLVTCLGFWKFPNIHLFQQEVKFNGGQCSRSCLRRAARQRKSELTQLIPPTHLCFIRPLTNQRSLIVSRHDFRILFWLKLGVLLSAPS
jgi:hypothetical protein